MVKEGEILQVTVEGLKPASLYMLPVYKNKKIELSDDACGLSLRVADNGPGIAPELREEVFVRGFTTQTEAGRGLGLALVAQIVRRHGGTVSVSEAESGGAVFDVRIPRKAGQ